jgi:hypothetical protein
VFEVIQVIDVANLIVALTSLVVAGVALIVANRVAAMGIAMPFVIQELYELYEYIETRRLGTDLAADVDRLFDEIKRIGEKRIMLELAGFREQLTELDARKEEFARIRRKLMQAQEAGTYTDDQGQELTQAAVAIDQTVQDLLRAIEPQLSLVMKNPLKKLV